MSFLINRPGNATAQAVALPQASAPPTPPAFRPQAMRSVRMHPKLAAGVAALVLLLLVGYGVTRKPVYSAESLVYEEPVAPKLLGDGGGGMFDSNGYESYLQQQMQVIERPDVLEAALAALPAATWQELGPNRQAAVGALQTQLKVARVTTSFQLSISLQGANPARTAAIVNAVTTAYLNAVAKDSAAKSDQRAVLLTEERARIENEMQAARDEQAKLSATMGVASPLGETANPYDFEIASVRTQLLTAREAHDVAAAQLASISGDGAARNTALAGAADEIIASDAGLGSMKATVSARRAQLAGQMAGMKPENPVYKQDQEELTDLDRTLDTLTTQLRSRAERQLQQKLSTDLGRTGDVEARLNAQLAQLTSRATGAAPKLQRAGELANDLERLNTRYAAVDDALRSLQMEANAPGIVRLSLAAAVPSTPEPSRKKLLLISSPLLALFFGVFAAVIARKRDHHIYSGRDIDELLGFPPVAVLPARADVSARVIDEYVLRLAAGIEGAYRSSGAQTFLLTAVSASTDIRPLRNALTAKLERIGLDVAVARTTDLLVAEPETSEDLSHELAKAGDPATDGFVSVHLAKLKAAHALVVIDAPALGTSAETEYVARCADATILVAECAITTREELLDSATLLERLNARGVGTVLQELSLRFADRSFRQSIENFEQRQPQRSHIAEQIAVSQVVPDRVPVSSPDTVGDVVLEIAPRKGEVISSQTEAAMPLPEAREREEVEAVVGPAPQTPIFSGAFRHRGMHESATALEIAEERHAAPAPRVAGSVSRATLELPIGPRNQTMREKIAPTRAMRLEQRVDGDVTMSQSRSWFHRFLHRDEEKVSIIPDGDDEADSVDEVSYLTSRISRVRHLDDAGNDGASPEPEPVIEAVPAAAEPARPQSPTEPIHADVPVEVSHEVPEAVDSLDHDIEAASAPVAASEAFAERWIEHESEPQLPEPQAEPLPAAVFEEPQPAKEARPRPARPLSFHELAAIYDETPDEVLRVQPTLEGAYEPVAESAASEVAEPIQAIEPVKETPAVLVEAFETHQPEVVTHLVQDEVVPSPAWVADDVPETPALLDPPHGTSRWDPIPTLRPTDSGWRREQELAAAAREQRGHDDWNWTNGDVDRLKASGERRWESARVEAEHDEPALSRPWGLLSRFQQTHQITPKRPSGAWRRVEDAEDPARDAPDTFGGNRRG